MKKSLSILIVVFAFIVGCTGGYRSNMKINSDAEQDVLGDACVPGGQGEMPDYSALVSQFHSQYGYLLNQDCSSNSNMYIGNLVQFLRGHTGDERIGYNANREYRDTITYVWDHGDCEGSENVSVIDVIGGFASCQNNNQWMESNVPGQFTAEPPENSGFEGPGPTPTPQPTPQPTPPPEPTPGTPPDEEDLVKQINAANPGMINDCAGQPIANNFLITTVRELQKKNPRWGFFRKPDGRIPRDILAYAWGNETEGTHNTFVIDFVMAGCNNSPNDPAFEEDQTNARPGWIVTNPDGYADNGVWARDP